MRAWQGVIIAWATACRSAPYDRAYEHTQRLHHELDFLMPKPPPDHSWAEFGFGSRVSSKDDIAAARHALREDSRRDIRLGALQVFEEAPTGEDVIPDYVFALDDTELDIVGRAAGDLAEQGAAYMDRDESREAVAGVRAHAAKLRSILTGPGSSDGPATVKYQVAQALAFVADRESMPILLRDPHLGGLGDGIADRIALGSADLQLLADIARPDPLANTGLVQILVDKAPDLGIPLLLAAIDRGDPGMDFARVVAEHHLTAAVPGILAFLQRTQDFGQRDWYDVLPRLGATCAARTLATLVDTSMGMEAADALKKLSGVSGSDGELVAWARAQPADVAPCKR